MANTRLRSMRIPDEVWDLAAQVAAERGETVTDVVRRALVEYGQRNRKTSNRKGENR
jgi:antitoxin component of RelBE/YafQ-DinJ toxin-antitoxin module